MYVDTNIQLPAAANPPRFRSNFRVSGELIVAERRQKCQLFMQFQQLVKMDRMPELPEKNLGRVRPPFRNLIPVICAAFLSFILIATILAPILAPFSYDQIFSQASSAPLKTALVWN